MIELRYKFGVVLVDDDYAWLQGVSFHLLEGYAAHSLRSQGKQQSVLMHHMIAGRPIGGLITDHRDGNRLNNTRANLRFCTKSQNMMNKGVEKGAIFPGVTRCPKTGRWQSRISVGGTSMSLGVYEDIRTAVVARVAAELKHHGAFSRTLSRSTGMARRNIIQDAQDEANEYGRYLKKALDDCAIETWNSAIAAATHELESVAREGELVTVGSVVSMLKSLLKSEDSE